MPNPHLIVREAVAADAESLYTLILGLAEHHNQRAAVRTSVAALLRDGFGDNPRFGAILAESHGEIVGYTSYTCNYSVWLGSPYMNIDDVFVLDSQRGRSVGEAMQWQQS